MDIHQKNHTINGLLKHLNQVQRGLEQPRLSSGMAVLDDILEGGLSWGELSEWGLPWGVGLRDLMLSFIAKAQEAKQTPTWALWIYGQNDIAINPLAWHARGIHLQHLRFVANRKPLIELKPLFLSSFFRLIVLDSVSLLLEEDYAFLARQARQFQQHIIVLHPYQLCAGRGNIWARLRVNCQRDFDQKRICLDILKGRQQRQFFVPIS